MIKEGTQFKVPTLEQFLANGWEEDEDGYLSRRDSKYGTGFAIAPEMFWRAGETLTVYGQVKKREGIWMAKGWYWPVQECLDICVYEPVDTTNINVLKCACGRGGNAPTHADYCDLVTGKDSFGGK